LIFYFRHRGPEDWWSRNATIEDWFDEMVGQANIINRFGGVHMEDIRGKRQIKTFLFIKEIKPILTPLEIKI